MSATGARRFREIRARRDREWRRRRVEITPPEGVPIGFEVAGLGARTAAQLVDVLLTLAVVVVLLIAAARSGWVSGTGIAALGALAFFALRVPYYIAAELAMNGRTFGKRAMGLRVISADGLGLSAHAVTLRNLMKEMEVFAPGTYMLAAPLLDGTTAAFLLLWIGVLLAVPLLNPRRQRLGDLAAGTLVVRTPRPRLLPDLARAAAADRFAFQPHHLDHYGRFELQTLEEILQVDPERLNPSAAAQHATNLARVRDAILSRTGYEGFVSDRETPEFLRAFYRTQRAYLENRRLFGDDRADKYHRAPPSGTAGADGEGGSRR